MRSERCLYSFSATADDLDELSWSLRDDDVEELLAFCGPSYESVDRELEDTWLNSEQRYAFYTPGAKLVALYGVGRTAHPEAGIIWFLANERIERCRKALAAVSRIEVRKMMTGKAMLYNYVYAGNPMAVSWMEGLHFELVDVFPEAGYLGDGFRLYCRFASEAVRARFLEHYERVSASASFPAHALLDGMSFRGLGVESVPPSREAFRTAGMTAADVVDTLSASQRSVLEERFGKP